MRITGYGDNLSLFIKNPVEGYEKYMMVNPEIGKKYFQKLEYTSPANDIFLRNKPENTYRIFVMGSSVVYGFPYDRNLMFSRILHQQLEDVYPHKQVEVVNTSITAINSFTLRDFIDEILDYAPDAILIYEGHNEFYGAFGIGSNESMSRNSTLARMHLSLMDVRFYQLFRNIVSGISVKIARGTERSEGTLMKRIVADADILLNSKEYMIAMDRFSKNMGYILKNAANKGVPVFLSEVVSNVSGMEPFNSIPNDTLQAAIDIYHEAQAAEARQDYKLALQLYYKAKDLDCLRFRASEDINSLIGELTATYGAHKVPMLAHFQNHSPNMLIGTNFMTEHVHPNIDGSFLMADVFFSAISESGVFGDVAAERKPIDYYKRNWGYTALDSLLAHHRIQLLMGQWPFMKEESAGSNYSRAYRPRFALDSLAFSVMRNPDLSLNEVRLKLAERYQKAGRIDLAYKEYESLIRMNPYIAANYRDAATCLLQLEDLPLALKYLQKSLDYEETFFATFRIAEIFLIMGDYEGAITHFNEAFYLAPEESKVNVLGKSYAALVYANNTERAKTIAAELERLRATQYLRVPPKRYTFNDYIPFQTKKQVQEAKELIDQQRNDEALHLLESSLTIYDSHVANRLIGEIHFGIKNHELAQQYFDRVYDKFRFDSQFLNKLVLLQLALNNTVSAKKYLEELKRIDPNSPQTRTLSMMLQ